MTLLEVTIPKEEFMSRKHDIKAAEKLNISLQSNKSMIEPLDETPINLVR
jgi:hypothetical protein